MGNGESFGQRVKARRHELGLTQDELAHRVGCAPITIRKTEHDDLRPSVQIAERLAMALAIPLEERAVFVRLARAERVPEPVTPTPMPRPEEIGIENLSGRAIRGYALGERLGTGGMGVVYRAIQPLVEREVALKIILPQYANQPDFIRRFETEAQLIARLEHPHIVPLYDYWREPGVAYLIMRLLRGGSVRNLLESGLLPIPTVERLIDQIGQALAAAHRVGVVHRDLKPANVLLDEDGNAYLADFGIAKNLGNPDLENLTQADAILGSPNYISPEQIRSEFVRPQTDIYCLGVMLYELLTGALPFQGPTPIDVMHYHLNAALPPLASHRTGLPATLDDVIQHATAKDPLARYADVESLLADWHKALAKPEVVTAATETRPEKPLVDADNPYKGLRAFGEGDTADFFGREALTAQLLARLGEGGDLARFLAVVGPSGCGKSSVVKAGLIPALRRGGLPGSDKWFIVELIPGAHPLEELEAALLRVAVNPPESLLSQLREDKRGLVRAARRCLPDDPEVELVLVIDQFEEVFTLVQDEAVRAQLLDSLVTAALDERSRVRIVITLRADFIDRPLSYVDFGELLRQRMELVLPLTPDELERAVTCPAERVGLQWETGLVAAIIHDVGDQPGALPLLQYALTGLFEKRDGRLLPRAAYRAIGGVLGALGRRAEEVYASLEKDAQALARQLFLRLVTLGEGVGDGALAPDTRRRVLRSELESLVERPSIQNRQSKIENVIDAFGPRRLLSFDRDPVTRGPTVEVAHEALLREWPRLRDWLSASRADIRLQRQLAAAALDWQSASRDTSFLLTGARLAQFEGWAAGASLALTQTERAFLDAGVAERQAQQEAKAARQKRELEAAQKLAEAEKRRAEEQTRSAARLRQRAVYLVLALGAALVLLVATLGLAQLSNRNLAAARAANTQAVAEVQNRSTAQAQAQAEANSRATAEAQAQGERNTALGAQATAQTEAWVRATAEANAQTERNAAQAAQKQAVANLALAEAQRLGAEANRLFIENRDYETAALLALRSLALQYTPQGDEALSRASRMDYPVRVWAGHTGEVRPMVFSADGKLMVSGDGAGTPILWDVTTGTILQRFKGLTVLAMATISPDGRFVASGGDDGVVIVWDAATGQELYRRDYGATVWGLAVTADGRLFIGGWDKTARLLNFATGEELRQFATSGAVLGVAISPDGNLALTGDDDGIVRLWDVQTGRERLKFSVPVPGWPWGFAFSPDLSTFAVAEYEKTAYIYDTRTGREIHRLVHTDELQTFIVYSPDDRYLLTGDTRGAAHLWDVQTGLEVRRFLHSTTVSGGAFTPDGQYVVTGAYDKVIRFWPLARKLIQTEADGAGGTEGKVAFTADGQSIFAQGKVYDVHTGEQKAKVANPEYPGFVGISADGKTAYVLSGNRVLVFDPATWAPRQTFTSCVNEPYSIGISPDGSIIALGAFGRPLTICLLDANTGQVLRTFDAPANTFGLVFSPDSRVLAAGACDTTTHLYDVATGVELKAMKFPGTPHCVNDIAFSPDGRYLLAAGTEDKLWLWDVQTGEKVREFIGHTGVIWGAAISRDGRYAVSGGADGTARLWDIATGKEVRRFAGHAGIVWEVAISPDAKLVATTSNDGTVKFWNTNLDDLKAAVCGVMSRDLTEAERRRYNITDTGPTCPNLPPAAAAQP